MSERTFAREGIDESALAGIAKKLAGAVGEGGVIHLVGPLGAGKTTFARALLTELGVGSRVKSPTYSLIESYTAGRLGVQHLDLYRIADAEEVEWLGLRDFAEPQLWLIEWPERAKGAIPKPDLDRFARARRRGARCLARCLYATRIGLAGTTRVSELAVIPEPGFMSIA